VIRSERFLRRVRPDLVVLDGQGRGSSLMRTSRIRQRWTGGWRNRRRSCGRPARRPAAPRSISRGGAEQA